MIEVKSHFYMKSKHLYILIAFLAISVRAYFNFQLSLIPGINGGYYAVQIREILSSGHMAVRDMPLLFYIPAFFVKIISFIPGTDINNLIINITKVIDCIALPLAVIPLFLISRKIIQAKYSILFELSIIALLLLSFAPLELSAEALKNNFALMLLLFFLYFFLSFLKFKTLRFGVLSSILLIIIALSHFGVFTVCLCFLFLGLIIFFRKKAVIPIIIVLVTAVFLVAVFDPNRAKSLFSFWLNVFNPGISNTLLFYYPLGLANSLLTFVLICLTAVILKRRKHDIPEYNRKMILLFLIVLVVLSFPFLQFEFGRRFGLMLFIPQSVILFLLYPYLKNRTNRIVSLTVLLFVVTSLLFHFINPKPLSITNEAYEDMKKINTVLENPAETIIYTRHDIEWWIVWELKTKVALLHIKVDDEIMEKYDFILFLTQKKGRNRLYPGKESPFKDPDVPKNNEVIFSSEYFELFKFIQS